MIAIIILCALLWYASGVFSFIFWWTEDEDFTSNELVLAIAAGVTGPLAFMGGFIIHGKHKPFVIKRAKNKDDATSSSKQ